jgi:DNA repair photolyase
MPFDWTLNPYRGCTHACTYCFARPSHHRLGLDAATDFDTQVVVKVNAPELLRRRLASPSWRGEHIAVGSNVDCYQRAEGRYRLMPGILAALRDRANPFSVLTKGALVLRDLDLLRQAAQAAPVHVAISMGTMDSHAWRITEPGAPPPAARLDVVRKLAAAGIEVGVLMMPILPGLGDHPEQLRETVRAAAQAGASWITPALLFLPSGALEWYADNLRRHRPELLAHYRRLFAGGPSLPAAHRDSILRRVREFADHYGIRLRPESDHWGGPRNPDAPEPTQLSFP